MSQISLRLPDSLHKAVKEFAERDNSSANQFITHAVAEKVSALRTMEWMEARARRAPDSARFAELVAKAPDVEPPEYDKL